MTDIDELKNVLRFEHAKHLYEVYCAARNGVDSEVEPFLSWNELCIQKLNVAQAWYEVARASLEGNLSGEG